MKHPQHGLIIFQKICLSLHYEDVFRPIVCSRMISLSDLDSFVLFWFLITQKNPTKQNEMHHHDHVRFLLRQNFASVVSAKKVLNKVSAEIDLYIKKASYLVASSWSDIHSFST